MPDNGTQAEPNGPTGATPVDQDPDKTKPDYGVIGRVVFGLIVGWVALVAIPGSLPLASTDDAQRVIALAAAIATILALVMVSIAWVGKGTLRKESALIATWCARVVVALAALQVVMVLLVPADWPYRMQALGIGLLVILGSALVAMSGSSQHGPSLGPVRWSNAPVIATLVAVLLIGGYLLFLSDLFKVVPGATDATWVRYTDIRTGLEALVFAAAGALFGTAVQRQVTSGVETDLANANAAVDELDSTLEHVVDEAAAGRLVAIEPTKSTEVLQRALLEDNALFLAAPQRLVDHARDLSLEAQSQPRDLVARIRGSQSRAVLLRTRRR